jgi:hypothetical protein
VPLTSLKILPVLQMYARQQSRVVILLQVLHVLPLQVLLLKPPALIVLERMLPLLLTIALLGPPVVIKRMALLHEGRLATLPLLLELALRVPLVPLPRMLPIAPLQV